MEAGNRCYDDRVPEEVNRRVIDHCSTVLMPYTQRSRENLIARGHPGSAHRRHRQSDSPGDRALRRGDHVERLPGDAEPAGKAVLPHDNPSRRERRPRGHTPPARRLIRSAARAVSGFPSSAPFTRGHVRRRRSSASTSSIQASGSSNRSVSSTSSGWSGPPSASCRTAARCRKRRASSACRTSPSGRSPNGRRRSSADRTSSRAAILTMSSGRWRW